MCVVSKIFEMVVHSVLYKSFCNLIFPHQLGFMKDHLTVTSLSLVLAVTGPTSNSVRYYFFKFSEGVRQASTRCIFKEAPFFCILPRPYLVDTILPL